MPFLTISQVDDDNMYRWKIGLWVVNPDSVWHGAYLKVSFLPHHDTPGSQ